MAFHGDLSSYPLPELLQWLDSSRKTGALHVTWDASDRKLFLLSGQIVATAAPGLWERVARVLDQGGEADGQRVMASLRSGIVAEPSIDIAVRQLAEEDLITSLVDLTQAQAGRFHWSEDPDRGEDEWVGLELSLRHALFESLRRIDEGADVERLLHRETLVVRPRGGPSPGSVLHRVVLNAAAREGGASLSRLWLLLGLPRSMLMRTVYDLLRAGRVTVDGAATLEADPIADMLEKGAVLVRERQFDAAGLVFAALLQSDPADRRVREFARMVEREYAAALYRELPPVTVFDVAPALDARGVLRPEERQLLELLAAGRDVSSVVFASPMRELDTLKAVQKFVRLGLSTVRAPEAG
jgi:hypothetical protein